MLGLDINATQLTLNLPDSTVVGARVAYDQLQDHAHARGMDVRTPNRHAAAMSISANPTRCGVF